MSNEKRITQTPMWWFRGLSKDLTDPRLFEMTGNDFRDLYMLMCVANGETPRGSLPPAASCGFHLHKTPAAAIALLNRLKGYGWLSEDGGRLWIADFEVRYRASDDAAARMANRRAKFGTSSEDVQNIFGTTAADVLNPSSSSSSSGSSTKQTDQLPEDDPVEEDVRAVLNMFRTHGIDLNPTVRQQITDAVSTYGAVCMSHCLRRAALNNKVSLAYVLASCRAHTTEGCPSDDEEHLTRRERMTAGKR